MTLEVASLVLALMAVAAAVTYYAYALRGQTRLRKANLLMGLYAKLDSLEFQEAWHRVFWLEYVDYDDAIDQLGGRHVGSFVFYFYDEVGIILRHKLIDEALAYDLFGDSLFQMWEKVKPIIYEARRRSADPTIYENWEYVYERLRHHRRAAEGLPPSRTEDGGTEAIGLSADPVPDREAGPPRQR